MKVISKYGVKVNPNKQVNTDGSFSYADDVSDANGLDFDGEFSYAFGKKKSKSSKPVKMKSEKKDRKGIFGGIFKKGGFKKFLGGLKAKKSARKLKRVKNKQGKEIVADVIPPLKPMSLPTAPDPELKITPQNFSGLGKEMPDGTMKPIAKEEVATGPDNKQYEKQDLNPINNETPPELVTDPENPGQQVLAKEVPKEDQVQVKAVDESNPSAPATNEIYKKSDVIDKDGKTLKEKEGMNPALKWGLIIGGVVLAGVVIYLIARKKKSNVTVLSSGQGGFTQISS